MGQAAASIVGPAVGQAAASIVEPAMGEAASIIDLPTAVAVPVVKRAHRASTGISNHTAAWHACYS